MVETEFSKQALSSFLKGAIDKGLTLRESERALELKGWPKKFIDKYCKKYYSIYKRRKTLLEKKIVVKEKKGEIDKQLDEINAELMKLR